MPALHVPVCEETVKMFGRSQIFHDVKKTTFNLSLTGFLNHTGNCFLVPEFNGKMPLLPIPVCIVSVWFSSLHILSELHCFRAKAIAKTRANR